MSYRILVNVVAVSNLLSFGPYGINIQLQTLNVLVGPNGSGKSNFLEVLRLLQASAVDLNQAFSIGGGVEHWLYKGEGQNKLSSTGRNISTIKVITDADGLYITLHDDESQLEHKISLRLSSTRATVSSEEISLFSPLYFVDEDGDKDEIDDTPKPIVGYEEEANFYSYSDSGGNASITHESLVLDSRTNRSEAHSVERSIQNKDLKHDQSILAQRNDPDAYPSLYQLNQLYKDIHLFTENIFGRQSPARQPQSAALDSTFLFPDASNLALVLNDLQNQPPVKRVIIEKLKLFYERVEDIITRVQGGTVQIFFQEEGLTQTVPASRLSDGTLRYLCLLVILCHPSPPPLICIEEPELGMHPDVLPTIAELLIEASQRTQLIITTHSDLLVSAIGAKHPEAIVVCEKGDNGTTMKRLEPEKMQEWLTRYSLGDLWLKGEIGGTRW